MTTAGIIWISMLVIVFLIVFWYYHSWFEMNPTTEEIIKESVDKHSL